MKIVKLLVVIVQSYETLCFSQQFNCVFPQILILTFQLLQLRKNLLGQIWHLRKSPSQFLVFSLQSPCIIASVSLFLEHPVFFIKPRHLKQKSTVFLHFLVQHTSQHFIVLLRGRSPQLIIWSTLRFVLRAEGRGVLLFIEPSSPQLLKDIRIDAPDFPEGRQVHILLVLDVVNDWVNGPLGLLQPRNGSRLEGRVISNLSGFVIWVGWFIEMREGHGLFLTVTGVATSVLVLLGCVQQISKHSSFWK